MRDDVKVSLVTKRCGDRTFCPVTKGARPELIFVTFTHKLFLLVHKTSVQISTYFSQNHCVRNFTSPKIEDRNFT